MLVKPAKLYLAGRPVLHNHVRPNLGLSHLGAISHFSSLGGGGGQKPPSKYRILQGIGVAGSGGLLLLGKGKYILGALKFGKLATFGSMFVTIGTYSMFFGLPYAAGIVGLTLVHETGHALVMLHRGIPFSPMVFVPFMGAVITMKNRPQDAWEEALVGFGGPVLGSVGALGCSLGGYATDSQLLYALADFGYFVNLINLLPIGQLDGGRITGALSPYAGVVGLGLGGMLVYNGVVQNPLMIVIMLAGGWQTYQRFSNPAATPRNYFKISNVQRTAISGGYFGLIAALLAAMAVNNEFKKPPEVLEQEKFWDERYGNQIN